MHIKRLYEKDADGELALRDGKPVVAGVRVLRAGARQNFSTRLVPRAVAEGWLTLSRGQIIVHAAPGARGAPDDQSGREAAGAPDLVYRIVRGPGYWCCHCGAALDNDKAAQAHLAAAHKDQPSPDENWPAGFACLNHYECVLVSDPPGAGQGSVGDARARPADREG